MNGAADAEAPRLRPLSGGLWTLFSWLRRDERACSNDSISSIGSDRTTASFAFLNPARYGTSAVPIVLPPPGPPTDSYKRRVQERNLRRQYDRDTTLHRKYGLYRSEGCGYDGFSLPPARRTNSDSKWDRERRATSECLQRRIVHVPGKRRAPLPPTIRASSVDPSNTLYARRRKRPAPLPPIKKTTEIIKVCSNQMDPESSKNNRLSQNIVGSGCKFEKYSQSHGSNKNTKVKSEKSFLKQIFENKKRHSAIDTSSIKLLPSISELDREAAEIIEANKRQRMLNDLNNQSKSELSSDINLAPRMESWMCTKCLKKYEPSVKDCSFCTSQQKLLHKNSNNNHYTQTDSVLARITNEQKTLEEKQKLKEMLKEMKDSLPKKPKHNQKETISHTNKPLCDLVTVDVKTRSMETPTLRIGSSISSELKTPEVSKDLLNEPKNITTNESRPKVQSLLPEFPLSYIVNSVVVREDSTRVINNDSNSKSENRLFESEEPSKKLITKSIHPAKPSEKSFISQTKAEPMVSSNSNSKLLTPLKISSLLNPVYIPKYKNNEQQSSNQKLDMISEKNAESSPTITVSTKSVNTTRSPITATKEIVTKEVKKVESKKITEINPSNHLLASPSKETTIVAQKSANVTKVSPVEVKNVLPSTSESSSYKPSPSTSPTDRLDQHHRRRDLINQLERSIAVGDERAAAEAAAKLAQLRLSCSVLSFSSQIIAEPITSVSESTVTKNDNLGQFPTNATKPVEPGPLLLNKKLDTTSPDVIKGHPIAPKKIDASASPQMVSNSNINNSARYHTDNKPSTSKQTDDLIVAINVWVEDKEAARGPVQLHVRRDATMGDLRQQVQTSWGLTTRLQRWIVGRALCIDDKASLTSLAGPDFSAPFYLCLVESEIKTNITNETTLKATVEVKTGNPVDVYTELVQLEQQALVPNTEVFECGVCIEEYPTGEGVVLRACIHSFCRACLADVVRHNEEPAVTCPAMGCRGILEEREIRALVSKEEYERWLARGLAAAESGTRNAFHCRTRDCTGWALCEPGVRRFPCPVCKHTNCVPCQAIHEDLTCEQHRIKQQEAAKGEGDVAQTDDSTRALLNTLIRKGEALECPECKAIITKKWGCDWIKCSACKTEICWVTRGRRWGPNGKGDLSGGCRCGVDGKRCHPSCGYCH